AAPLPPNRLGIVEQAKMLAAMAKGTDCPSTAAAAYVEELDPADMLCQGASNRKCSDDGAAVVDCSRLQIEHCDNALLGESTVCDAYGPGVACATGHGCIDGTGLGCSGGSLSYCFTALSQVAGCPVRGLKCPGGTISCANNDGMVETCQTVGETKCEGGQV